MLANSILRQNNTTLRKITQVVAHMGHDFYIFGSSKESQVIPLYALPPSKFEYVLE